MPIILSHIYKSTIIILLIQLMQVSVNGQNVLYTPVELSSKVNSTKAHLNEIEQQTSIVFSFSSQLCFQESVELPIQRGSVREILNALFINCPSNYIVRGNKIIIEPIEGAPRKFVIKGFVL
ncbi:MAG: hypothetical protein N4A74_09725, partial [Carboxylicivirga sp.]|nr:hypothetical protein [Carboxylicivirga sp.]